MASTRTRAGLGAALVVALVAGFLLVGASPSAAQVGFEPVFQFRRQYGMYHSRQSIDEAMSSPAVGDVTGDGVPDVVVGSMDGVLEVLDINTGAVLRYVVVDQGLPGAGGMIQASPALVDLTGDGVLDVITATTNAVHGNPSPVRSYVQAWDMTGGTVREIFRASDVGTMPMNGFFGTPVAGDIDGDAQLEIVASGLDHHVYAWNLDGSAVPGFPVYTYDTMLSSPALADFDGDGLLEIVVGGDMDHGQPLPAGGYIWALNGDGSAAPGYPHRVGAEVVWSSPAIADINGDGSLDAVFGTGQHFVNSDSSLLHAMDLRTRAALPGWPVALAGFTMPSPALGDVHGDGRLEVVASTSSGNLYAVNHAGQVIWGMCALAFSCGVPGVNIISSPVIADIDGDGIEEVLYNGERQLKIVEGWGGRVKYDGQTNTLSASATEYAHAGASAPAVASVGGRAYVATHIVEERNGDHRRGPGDNQGVYVWRSSANTAAASWPTFQQNAARTGTIRTDPSVFSGYVDAAYQTLLGRPADAPGRLYWSTLLANGMPRGEFALALARTPEWVNTVIAGQYQQILGRSPDGPGLAYWSQHVRGGMRIAALASNLYASAEFYAAAGNTDAGWVNAMYQNILGRAPDPTGHAYWMGQLAAGVPRQTLANALFLSYESNIKRVDALYAQILGRAPDPGGRDYWGKQLATLDDINLAALLVASDEYFAKHR